MMNPLSIFKHESWYRIQTQSSLGVQRSFVPYLDIIREYAILIFRPYLTTYQLKGQTKEGPITIQYAVSGADTQLKFYFKSILFEQEPVEEETFKMPIWHLGKLINNPSIDLILIGAGENLIRRLPTRNAVVLPRIVNQSLDVQGEWEDILKRMHKNLRKTHLKLMRRFGYEYEVSDKDKDFDLFFHEMYLPSMKVRHGRQAYIASYANAYESFKRGILFLTKRDGIYVSGGLCDIPSEPGVVNFLLVGVMNADQQLMDEGAQSAVYHAVIHWANKHHFKKIDFQGTEPYLSKGILENKKRWGAFVRIQSNKRLWLKIHRHTPAVNRFLKDNPCIMINEQGNLQGLFFADNPDHVPAETKAEWDKLCAMPGLNGYCIRSVEDLVRD
jgi:hypothetical protein